jgi:hypothetical protein
MVADDHRHQPGLAAQFETGEVWAEPHVAQAAAFMAHLYAHQDDGRRLGERAAADIRRWCSRDAVGARIEARIQHLDEAAARSVRRAPRCTRLLERHAEALRRLEQTRYGAESLPGVARLANNRLSVLVGRVPFIGHLVRMVRTLQAVRQLRVLLAQQLLLHQIALEEAQAICRTMRSIQDSVEALHQQAGVGPSSALEGGAVQPEEGAQTDPP